MITLCWAYRAFLMTLSARDREIIDVFYAKDRYARLMDDLPRLHSPPTGAMVLARGTDSTALACGMTHALDPETAEIKRVFVQPEGRGQGIARALCQALIDTARAQGFDRVVLDTSLSLTAAQALYLELGFVERGPYQPVPEDVRPHMKFFELTL